MVSSFTRTKGKFILQSVYNPAAVRDVLCFMHTLILLVSICRVLSRGLGILGSTDKKWEENGNKMQVKC